MKIIHSMNYIIDALKAEKKVLLVARDRRSEWEYIKRLSSLLGDKQYADLVITSPMSNAVLGCRFDLIVYEYPHHIDLTEMLRIAQWIFDGVRITLSPDGEEVELQVVKPALQIGG